MSTTEFISVDPNISISFLSHENINAVRVRDLEDIRRAATALHQLSMNATGMRVATMHDIADPRTPIDASGTPLAGDIFGWPDHAEAWWKCSSLALKSPIANACRFESDTFWVNVEGFHTRSSNRYLREVDLRNFEARTQTRAAIVVPVHLPFGQIGLVSYSPIESRKIDLSREYKEFGSALSVLGREFITSYVNINKRRQRLDAEVALTRREIQCLRGVAAGKTDAQIGEIISLGRATVRFHIRNASMKLDAVNRSQTVFKAAQLGFLSLMPIEEIARKDNGHQAYTASFDKTLAAHSLL